MSTYDTFSARDTAEADLGPHTPKPTAMPDSHLTEASFEIWATDRIQTGLWECTPGSFRAERDGYTEICTILSGSTTIKADGMQAEPFGPGDVVVMPSGWKGEWHVSEHLRKHYTIVFDN